jgi:leader peptidase (prepilin peptidase) / N-methyltransferase
MTITGLWWVLAGFAVAIGLCIGSFLNVVIARLPEDRSLLPGSACDTCGVAIPFWRNVPVVSFVLQRGKCASCGADIPASTPVIEALGGAVGYLAWARCVPMGPIDLPHVAAAFALMALLSLLIAASEIDLRHRILPDELTIYAVPVALLVVTALDLGGVHVFPFPTWRSAVLGAGLPASGIAAIGLVMTRVLRQEALGWGDVKLMALLGACLGFIPGAVVVLMAASLIGSIAGLAQLLITGRRGYLPLGPCLAWSAAAYALYGDVLLPKVFPNIGYVAGW